LMVKDIGKSLPSSKELKELNELIDETKVLSDRLDKINQLIEVDSVLSLSDGLFLAENLYQECQLLVRQLAVLKFQRDITNISENIATLQSKIEGQICPICDREINF